MKVGCKGVNITQPCLHDDKNNTDQPGYKPNLISLHGLEEIYP